MSELEDKFTETLFEMYRRAKVEANYPANTFYQMLVTNGGLATAKKLINSKNPSDGYTALYMKKRLDLTVEAVVVENKKWHPLFSVDELERARRRLKEYGYKPNSG